jgi:hypothetical protein
MAVRQRAFSGERAAKERKRASDDPESGLSIAAFYGRKAPDPTLKEPPPSKHRLRTRKRTGDNAALGASNTQGYTGRHGGPVGDADEIQEANIVARVRSMPREKLPALAKLIDDLERASGETTGRATGEPRPKLTPDEIRRAKLQSRLDGLQLKYEERLEALELPPEGFTTKKQAAAAATLATNLRRVQELQAELGFSVTEWPDRVSEAENMASAYRRTHTKTGEIVPRRPRGRPRRTSHERPPTSP